MGSVILLATALPAQAAPPQNRRDKIARADSEVVVTGKRPSDCTAKAGTAKAPDYACLSFELKAAAKPGQSGPPAEDAITGQADQPNKAGTFSYSATHQRLGSNFGKSAQLARPPAPVFTTPVVPARPK
ncbi:MAG: hypothetical protein PHU85_08450 [Phycisphaerae bacterium]|nr:hypothetical protein [Phycisphaerae bacterium]